MPTKKTQEQQAPQQMAKETAAVPEKQTAPVPDAGKKTTTASKKKTGTQRGRTTTSSSKKSTTGKKKSEAQEVEATPASTAEQQIQQEQFAAPAQQESANTEKKQETPLLAAPNKNLPVTGGHGGAVERAVPRISLSSLMRERRNFFGMFLMFFVIGAVLLASIFIFLYRPTAYSERQNSVLLLYNGSNDTTTVVVNGVKVGESYAGRCSAHMYDSTGDTSAALIGGVLYLIDGREVSQICGGVLDFVLSQNGHAVAYRTEENKLYYCELGREIEHALMSNDTRDARYCLSPNGKELFYTYVHEEMTRIELYSTTNNKPEFSRVTDYIPVAVANNCNFIYYMDATDGTLYYYKNGAKSPVICYKGEEPYTLVFNRDFSEMLINTANGTQLWQKGEQTVIPLLKSGEHLEFLPNKRAETREMPAFDQYLVKSFDKGYYLKSGNSEDGTMLMYLNSKGELTLVHYVQEDVGKPVVTDKGVYFLAVQTRSEVETLMHLRRCEIGETESELLYQGVLEFCVNTDGSRVLYTAQQGALYAMRPGEVPERLADQVNAGSMKVTSDDAFYYYVGDSLYTSDNGTEPRLVREDAALLLIDVHTAYFFVKEGEGETFTVYSNHRNRRRDTLVTTGISDLFY